MPTTKQRARCIFCKSRKTTDRLYRRQSHGYLRLPEHACDECIAELNKAPKRNEWKLRGWQFPQGVLELK